MHVPRGVAVHGLEEWNEPSKTQRSPIAVQNLGSETTLAPIYRPRGVRPAQ